MNRARTLTAAVLILLSSAAGAASFLAPPPVRTTPVVKPTQVVQPSRPVRTSRPIKHSLAPAAIRRAQDLSMGALREGNSRFVKGDVKAGLEASGKWDQLKKGQRPWAMVVSCADSRVVPETLFTRKPGDLFVCRVAGNVTDSDLVASLEYGAEHLEIPVLVVLGHTSCGAVKAAMEKFEVGAGHDGHASMSLEGLLSKIEPSVVAMQNVRRTKDLTEDQQTDLVVENNVRNTMRTVTEKSPLLWQLWREQKLRIVGAVYSLETGKVKFLEK